MSDSEFNPSDHPDIRIGPTSPTVAMVLSSWNVRLAREVRSIVCLSIRYVPEFESLAFFVVFKFSKETFNFIVPSEVYEIDETNWCHETVELIYGNLVDAIVDVEDMLIDEMGEGGGD